MLLRTCLRSRSSLAVVVVMAALIAASCASSGERSSDDANAGVDQAKRDELGRKINACAIQKARIDRARNRPASFERLNEAVDRVFVISRGEDERARRERSSFKWSDDFDPDSIDDVRVVLDADGLRIEASAVSWADMVEFLVRVDLLYVFEMSVAKASQAEDGRVHFELGHVVELVEPAENTGFNAELFPPTKGRTLEEYAAAQCDFGEPRPPEAPSDLAELDGLSFEKPEPRREGAWTHHILRVRTPPHHLHAILMAINDNDGASLERDGGEVVLDLYRTVPSEDFEPADWLKQVAREANAAHDHPMKSPPDYGELITWSEDNQFPVGVRRSALGGVSWYHYQRIQRIYREIADHHARGALADALRERNVRALRASLCTLRAYAAPYEDAPESQVSPLHAAKLGFSVPADESGAALRLERLRLSADGTVEWALSSSNAESLEQAEAAFSKCMRAPDWTVSESEEGGRLRLSGKATASSTGLYVPGGQEIEVPRFDDGESFVAAVRKDAYGFRNELYRIRSNQRNGGQSKEQLRVLSYGADVDKILSEFSELTGVYQLDVTSFRQRHASAFDWSYAQLVLLEFEASATPANLLGFIAQLFDLDRVLVPAELRVSRDEGRLRLHAQVYAFYGSR